MLKHPRYSPVCQIYTLGLVPPQIHSFKAIDGLGTIQCILNIPLAHVALPEALR